MRFNEAAAHHRGEPERCDALFGGQPLASMRPRLITAENEPVRRDDHAGHPCFNEAAAHHRGEPVDAVVAAAEPNASMRPRLITAENLPKQYQHNHTT